MHADGWKIEVRCHECGNIMGYASPEWFGEAPEHLYCPNCIMHTSVENS